MPEAQSLAAMPFLRINVLLFHIYVADIGVSFLVVIMNLTSKYIYVCM